MKFRFAKVHLLDSAFYESFQPGVDNSIPEEFDFSAPEESARRVFAAIAARATEAGAITNCKLMYHAAHQVANLTADGVHAYYSPHHPPQFTKEDHRAFMEERIFIELGNVRCPDFDVDKAVWKPKA